MAQLMMCDVWALRHQAGCNQQEAAEICEVSLSTFTVWEAAGRALEKHISKLAIEAQAFVDAAAAPIKKALQDGETTVHLVRYVDARACRQETGWSLERYERFLTLQIQLAATEGLYVETERGSSRTRV